VSHCEENISRIDLYLDGELGENDLEVFDRHIQECSSCREELTRRRRFLELIRAATVVCGLPEFSRGDGCTFGSGAGKPQQPRLPIFWRDHSANADAKFRSKPPLCYRYTTMTVLLPAQCLPASSRPTIQYPYRHCHAAL
jgi:hypothetical protein